MPTKPETGGNKMNQCHITIADMIRKARLKKGMSQLDLAKSVNTSLQFIWIIEHGRSKVPLATIGPLCDILELPKRKIYLLLLNEFKDELDEAFGEGWK